MGEFEPEPANTKQDQAPRYPCLEAFVSTALSSLFETVTEQRTRPAVCAIARLPFIHAAYSSSNYTIGLYKLGMPTQLQLHLSVVALSLGKIFRFLSFLDVGYLSSAIEPTHGKGTANRSRAGKYGYNSKISHNHSANNHAKKPSISDHDSSKNLVPDDYGQATVDAVPMGRMNGGVQPERQYRPGHASEQNRGSGSGRQPTSNEIMVTQEYEIRSESAAKKGRRDGDIEAY